MHNADFLPFRRFISLSAQRPSPASLLKHNKGYKFYNKEICVYCNYLEFPMPYLSTLLHLATLLVLYVVLLQMLESLKSNNVKEVVVDYFDLTSQYCCRD
jgi:hypothetical protein